DGTRAAPVVTRVSESRPSVAPEIPPSLTIPVVLTPAPPPPAAAAPQTEEVHVVRSPMVGTFYNAPGQGAPPFVRAGDRIEVGQVLCIIEAMKLMNEIESEIAGEVLRCYVETGQPVEYGEPLFDLRPGRRA
ncbi:MAG: acetyl-CoA carboxylase biotin carboxyl carrier protein, partial [Terriglobia bacterium]